MVPPLFTSVGPAGPDEIVAVQMLVSLVPKDEIATAIARCAGNLTDSVASGETIVRGQRRAIRYGGS